MLHLSVLISGAHSAVTYIPVLISGAIFSSPAFTAPVFSVPKLPILLIHVNRRRHNILNFVLCKLSVDADLGLIFWLGAWPTLRAT